MNKFIVNYYENSWKDKQGLQMPRELAVLGYEWAKSIPKGAALDIGCGDGTNALQLQKLGFTVEGCEISETAVKKAMHNGIQAKVADLNNETLPFKPDTYSFIWFTDVIEHVFEPNMLLHNIYGLLKKNGYLYLTTPNVAWYGIRLEVGIMGKTLHDVHPGHIHWFNRKRLLQVLSDHGFEIIKFKAYRRIIPYPLISKVSILGRLNTVGKPDNLWSHSFAILAKK